MRRRLIAVGLAALPMLALVALRAAMMNGYCYPGCALWTDSDPQYFLFLCYLCGY